MVLCCLLFSSLAHLPAERAEWSAAVSSVYFLMYFNGSLSTQIILERAGSNFQDW